MPTQPNQSKSTHPQTTISKIKDSILIITIATITPNLLSLFHYPITKLHYTILFLLTIISILIIFTPSSQPNTIQQVFEANNIQINGKYPTLLKRKGDKSHD